MKWPGSIFNNNGKEWICGICEGIANAGSELCLRQVVRRYHTVERFAQGVRKSPFGNSRTLSTKNAELQGHGYHSLFVSTLVGETHGSSDRVLIPPLAREGDARCRSRSPTLSRKDKQPMEDIDEFIGKRVTK
jgi:hypothetical protein